MDIELTPRGPFWRDDIVVRGGIMVARDLEVSAYTHYDETGEFALSVYVVPGWSTEEIAQIANLPNAQIRTSSVGRILAAGYEIERSEPPPGHADLKLPNAPTDADWDMLRDIIFEVPTPNPHPRPKR